MGDTVKAGLVAVGAGQGFSATLPRPMAASRSKKLITLAL
jgi:hypothetical protein